MIPKNIHAGPCRATRGVVANQLAVAGGTQQGEVGEGKYHRQHDGIFGDLDGIDTRRDHGVATNEQQRHRDMPLQSTQATLVLAP